MRKRVWAIVGWWVVSLGVAQGLAWAETGGTVSQTPAPVPTSVGQEYDFGDFTSETLTTKAWEALDQGNPDAAEAYARKCIELYSTHADQQAGGLADFAPEDTVFDYWAMNDVATSALILGKVLVAQGRIQEARVALSAVVTDYPFAQAWDPRGWFWKVAQAAQDQLDTMGTPYDFGDASSQTLTTKAWEALGRGDHKGVELYTKKCIELYEDRARAQQASLTDFVDWRKEGKEKVFSHWALNDVATCYFIRGESWMAQSRYDKALEVFELILEDFPYAQCWDPKGWFWKVAAGARERINKISVLTDEG